MVYSIKKQTMYFKCSFHYIRFTSIISKPKNLYIYSETYNYFLKKTLQERDLSLFRLQKSENHAFEATFNKAVREKAASFIDTDSIQWKLIF